MAGAAFLFHSLKSAYGSEGPETAHAKERALNEKHEAARTMDEHRAAVVHHAKLAQVHGKMAKTADGQARRFAHDAARVYHRNQARDHAKIITDAGEEVRKRKNPLVHTPYHQLQDRAKELKAWLGEHEKTVANWRAAYFGGMGPEGTKRAAGMLHAGGAEGYTKVSKAEAKAGLQSAIEHHEHNDAKYSEVLTQMKRLEKSIPEHQRALEKAHEGNAAYREPLRREHALVQKYHGAKDDAGHADAAAGHHFLSETHRKHAATWGEGTPQRKAHEAAVKFHEERKEHHASKVAHAIQTGVRGGRFIQMPYGKVYLGKKAG